jgi:hypothetical protein
MQRIRDCVRKRAERDAYARVADYEKHNRKRASRRSAFGRTPQREVTVISSDSESELEPDESSGAESALREHSGVHAGRLEDGMRMELDVESPAHGKMTYTYKLRRLFRGGNNAVYAARVAKLESFMDVDAASLMHAARAKARGGAARGLSKESVAVLMHDVIDAAYGTIAALDVASAVLESGAFTGEKLCALAKKSNATQDELVRGGFCHTEIAAHLDEHLSDLFSDEDERVAVRASTEAPTDEPRHVWLEDLIVRMSIRSVPHDDRDSIEEYWSEVQQSRRVSEAGLAPAVYARMLLSVDDMLLSVDDPSKGSGLRVHPCVVLERFECSLDDVQLCPNLTRRMFVESDGEASLIDLYARASGHMRCIDTKPGNVVVRLPKPIKAFRDVSGGTKAARRATRDRMLPRMALIDVDPRFCGDPSALSSRMVRVAGASTVVDLDSALAAFVDSDWGSSTVYGTSPLLAAAMSLLVHCAVGAAYTACGYPYISITRVLLSRWESVVRLVQLDEEDDPRHAMVPGKDSTRIMEQLQHYTQPPQGKDTLEHVRGILTGALEKLETNVLALCSGQGSASGHSPETTLVDPAMYEYTALLLLNDNLNKKSKRDLRMRLEKVTLLSELQHAVESLSSRNMFTGVRPQCWLEPSGSCAFHYHGEDNESVQRGLTLPDIVDRPLLTHRPSTVAVRAAADPMAIEYLRFLKAPKGGDYGSQASAEIASLMHDLVLDEFGAPVATAVARAVLGSSEEWTAERLARLARDGSLAPELQKLHITSRVARHIAHKHALSL